ncbi:hypothetical protein [Mycobacteroides abscessus]|uniref:hypothetical protein n=1 Tax=Mycobacteroides abscessus TaxID=36809 RepID=UPI0009A7116E|nr:hypothetical protein [Mycobacteroides abscessus]RIT48815.1 hypothetical protein D2E80_11970 [Mycobacteroides abscessus]
MVVAINNMAPCTGTVGAPVPGRWTFTAPEVGDVDVTDGPAAAAVTAPEAAIADTGVTSVVEAAGVAEVVVRSDYIGSIFEGREPRWLIVVIETRIWNSLTVDTQSSGQPRAFAQACHFVAEVI